MFRTWLLLLAILAVFSVDSAAFEVVAVYPEQVVAGEQVTVLGGPFEAGMEVLLGGVKIVPEIRDPRHLVMVTPPLEPGVYPLTLVDTQRNVERVFRLQVVLPPPEIVALEPSRIDECYDRGEHMIALRGRHLHPGTRVLLNGLAVPSELIGEDELRFAAPELPAGVYGVQVVHPDGNASLPQSLEFSNSPEIFEVSRGEDFVNYYQLVIRGKNFFQQSLLVVSEYPPGLSDLPPQQRAIRSRSVPGAQRDGARLIRREEVFYQDCHTLIYHRYPLSGEERRVILRISNPDGKQTSPYELSIP